MVKEEQQQPAASPGIDPTDPLLYNTTLLSVGLRQWQRKATALSLDGKNCLAGLIAHDNPIAKAYAQDLTEKLDIFEKHQTEVMMLLAQASLPTSEQGAELTDLLDKAHTAGVDHTQSFTRYLGPIQKQLAVWRK